MGTRVARLQIEAVKNSANGLTCSMAKAVYGGHVDAEAAFLKSLSDAGLGRVSELEESTLIHVALQHAVWIPADSFVRAPWLAPFAVRKLRIRDDAYAPGPRRDLWGLPDDHGYFSDDNSLLKGVFRNRRVVPASGPYGGGPITRGLVCCHIWANTTSNPLLFSFVPNLVWLPRSLAPFSDAHHGTPHRLHEVLKSVSVARYKAERLQVGASRVALAWQALTAESVLDSRNGGNEFVLADQLVDLVEGRLSRLTEFLAATLDPAARPPARFSKRYHAGTGKGIDPSVWPVQRIVPEHARLEMIEMLQSSREPV